MNFLLEIGTEEIPASYLAPYSRQLKKLFADEFSKLNLNAQDISLAFTPRRITLFCENLAETQPVKNEKLKGPPASVAFKEGSPTKAAEAFAKKTGVAVEKLETKTFDGREYLYAEIESGGAKAVDLLKESIPAIIRKLRSPKSMRWEEKPTVFARPVRWLMALFGEEVIPAGLDGLKADRISYGHRFISPDKIIFDSADREIYKEKLKSAYVILDSAEREQIIINQLLSHGAIEERIDKFLVATCANLVEWPNVIRGIFPDSMLELPESVLENALKKHQKSFLIYNENGSVAAGFLSVTNNDLEDEKLIRSGYERVILARLDDAKFFWDEDRKEKLSSRVEKLKNIVFQDKLGSYFDKTNRICELVDSLANTIDQPQLAKPASRAACLSRADLTTAMVNEFPNLQGIMGKIYARETDSEPENVCNAIEEMYKPRSADDSLPVSLEGALLSIADRIDTLTGCSAVGLAPTGSADPYALRRQSLGMLKTIIKHNLHFSIKKLLEEAAAKFNLENSDKAINLVIQIIQGRFESMLKENGVRYDVINAVISSGWDDITDAADKAVQLTEIVDSPEFQRACTIVERCYNITKSEELLNTEVDENLFSEQLEKELWSEWKIAEKELEKSIEKNDYKTAVNNIAGKFYDKLNVFFDDVRVNAEDDKLKNNRLKLVRSIRDGVVDKLADLAKIVFED